MKAEDILDAIGDVDDVCIKKAKKNQKSTKKLWIIVGSIAAGLVLILSLPVIYVANLKMGAEKPESSVPSQDYEISKVEIRYLIQNKITYETKEEIQLIIDFLEAVADTKQGIAHTRTDRNDELHKDDFHIYFFDKTGTLMSEYVLNQNIIFDYQTYIEYELTESEVAELHRLLGILKEKEGN